MKKRLVVLVGVVLLILVVVSVAEPSIFSFLNPIQSSPLPETTTVYAYGANGLVSKQEGSEVSYYHKDSLGSSSLVTDEEGVIKYSTDYYPFGSSLHEEGEEKYTYNGKEFDSTGLHYYGARYYDASIGRFISVDPASGNIFDTQRLNRYSYTLNNPLKYIDPTGRSEEPSSLLIVGNDKERGMLRNFLNVLAGEHTIKTEQVCEGVECVLSIPEDFQSEYYPQTVEMLKEVMSSPENIILEMTDKGSHFIGDSASGFLDSTESLPANPDANWYATNSRIGIDLKDSPYLLEEFGIRFDPPVILAHELLGHGLHWNIVKREESIDPLSRHYTKGYYARGYYNRGILGYDLDIFETQATYVEDIVRAEFGLQLRKAYLSDNQAKNIGTNLPGEKIVEPTIN